MGYHVKNVNFARVGGTISAKVLDLGVRRNHSLTSKALCKRGSTILLFTVTSTFVSLPHFAVELTSSRLPLDVSQDLGAILEPLGVAIHGSRRAALKTGSVVLIFGAGAVGLLCAAMAKVNGAARVIIADIQAERVDFAVTNKFADAKVVVPMKRPQAIEEKLAFAKEVAGLIKEASGVDEVDAVFECTGVESCLQTAIYVRTS